MKKLLMSMFILGFAGIPVGALGQDSGSAPGEILSCVEFALQDRDCRNDNRTGCDLTASNVGYMIGTLRPYLATDGDLPMLCGKCPLRMTSEEEKDKDQSDTVTYVCVGHEPVS